MKSISLAFLVGSFPTCGTVLNIFYNHSLYLITYVKYDMIGMLFFSFLLSNMIVSDLTSAGLQNFTAGLILAAGKIYVFLSIIYNYNNSYNLSDLF